MNINLRNILLGDEKAATEARTGPAGGDAATAPASAPCWAWRILLQSIAVPEPFSLELAGDMRRRDPAGPLPGPTGWSSSQLAAHYPQARVREISDGGRSPCACRRGRAGLGPHPPRPSGPEYVPLRTFRDDDLLDPGSDPLHGGASAPCPSLRPGERIVARLLLRSLGPEWSQAHQARRPTSRPCQENREPSYTYQTRPLQVDGVTMAVLGAGALLAAVRGYLWVQDGEILEGVACWEPGQRLLGIIAVAGWGWWRWKKARSRVYDPLLIREKVSRIAFDAELQVSAFLPERYRPNERACDLLKGVAAAYRHYNHPAGAQVQGQRGQAPVCHRRPPPGQPAPRRAGVVRRAQRPGRPRGGVPVAPAGRGGRDAPGGALRLQGAGCHQAPGGHRRPARRWATPPAGCPAREVTLLR